MFVIARTASRRPTLQHGVLLGLYRTWCGLDVWPWSRAYQREPIPQILCTNCKRIGEAE